MATVAAACPLMSMEPRLPLLTRLLLRLLREASRARAQADLHEILERSNDLQGRSMARRSCNREALAIVFWACVDRYRCWSEHRARRGERTLRRREGRMMDFAVELRQSLRSLGKRPGFTLIAVGVLALGMGATATIFTLASRLFFDAPVGVAEPDRLVRAFRVTGTFASGSLSYPDYLDYRAAGSSLEDLAVASSSDFAVTARLSGGAQQVSVRTVTENWFDVLGVVPAAGRWFTAEENQAPETHAVAVLSWRIWQELWAGNASVIGGELLLNGRRFTIVGVAPRGFNGLSPSRPATDVFIPIMMRPAISPQRDIAWRARDPQNRENWLEGVGRLREGATVARAQAELSVVADRIYPAQPDRPREGVYLTSDYRWTPATQQRLVNLTRLLLATVLGLLLVAASNLAILLLARATSRMHDAGIRAAIGAGRMRLVREQLTESLLIGLAGGALGLGLSVALARFAAALLPVTLDVSGPPDARMLLLTLAVALFTAAVVGVIPAARMTRSDLARLIAGRGRTVVASGRGARDALIVVQVALSLVLVTGAALFARSLRAARAVDIGFDTRNALLVTVDLAPRGYTAERGRVFMEQALERLRGLPGVSAATVTRQVPFRGDWTTTLEPWQGVTFAGGASELIVGLNAVADGYFDAMRIPIRRGRPIEASDVPGSERAVIVNEAFARAAFPEGDPLGRTVPAGPVTYTIVGLAADAMYYEFGEAPHAQVYLPLRQSFQLSMTFLLKTSGAASAMVRPAQDVLRQLDPDLAFPGIETLEAVYADQLAGLRTSASVVGITGLVALMLAGIGLFGVMAYGVAERTREIGLRMALGATRVTVARRIVFRALLLTGAGIAIGLMASLLLGRLVQSLLFGIPPRDPVSLGLAPLILLSAASLAAWIPARRAMSVDPMGAMRSD